MKTIIFKLALIISMPSYAITIICTPHIVNEVREEMKEALQKQITLTHIESETRLSADLSDQNMLTPFTSENGVARASFSNECDNMYEISFIADDFNDVIGAQRSGVTGTLTYNVNDGENRPLFAIIECKVK